MADSREVADKGGFEVGEEVKVFSIDLHAFLKGVCGIDESRRVAEPHKRVKGKKIATWYYEKSEKTMSAVEEFYSPSTDRARGATDFRRAQIAARAIKRIMEEGG